MTNISPSICAPVATPLPPQVTCLTNGSTLVYNLGIISNGAVVAVTNILVPASAGLVTNTSIAATASADLFPGDGMAQIVTQVVGSASFLQAASLGGGAFQLTVLGFASQSYAIQASTDLVNWSTVANYTVPYNTNQFSFQTNIGAFPSAQFFRVVQIPQ